MAPVDLEVRVEGEDGAIPARSFLTVLRTSLDLLDQLEHAANPGAKKAAGWLIAELRNASAAALLRPADTTDEETAMRLVDGITQLREREELPPYFSPDIAAGIVKIGKQARVTGVSGVIFTLSAVGDADPRTSERITDAVIENAQRATEATETALGSVSGLLDAINLRRGAHEISLYDQETRRAVRCRFPDELFAEVQGSLAHKVRAFGELTRNARGQILRMRVDRIESLPDAVNAPTVDELAGIAPWYTGEQSSDDFVRAARGG